MPPSTKCLDRLTQAVYACLTGFEVTLLISGVLFGVQSEWRETISKHGICTNRFEQEETRSRKISESSQAKEHHMALLFATAGLGNVTIQTVSHLRYVVTLWRTYISSHFSKIFQQERFPRKKFETRPSPFTRFIISKPHTPFQNPEGKRQRSRWSKNPLRTRNKSSAHNYCAKRPHSESGICSQNNGCTHVPRNELRSRSSSKSGAAMTATSVRVV